MCLLYCICLVKENLSCAGQTHTDDSWSDGDEFNSDLCPWGLKLIEGKVLNFECISRVSSPINQTPSSRGLEWWCWKWPGNALCLCKGWRLGMCWNQMKEIPYITVWWIIFARKTEMKRRCWWNILDILSFRTFHGGHNGLYPGLLQGGETGSRLGQIFVTALSFWSNVYQDQFQKMTCSILFSASFLINLKNGRLDISVFWCERIDFLPKKIKAWWEGSSHLPHSWQGHPFGTFAWGREQQQTRRWRNLVSTKEKLEHGWMRWRTCRGRSKRLVDDTLQVWSCLACCQWTVNWNPSQCWSVCFAGAQEQGEPVKMYDMFKHNMYI